MPEKTLFEDYDKLSGYLCKLARERMVEKGNDFCQALSEIRAESPALFRLAEALYERREQGTHNTKMLVWVDGRLREVEQDIKGLVQKAMDENPKLTHGAAFKLVASEHPDLFRERERLQDL